MAYYKFGMTPNDEKQRHEFFSPVTVDQQIRQAIQFCWISLPQSKRKPSEIEEQIRRIVDRALQDFNDDYLQFVDEKRDREE